MKQLLLILLIATACSSSKTGSSSKNVQKTPLADANSFAITEFAVDKSYGYSAENPVKVGGNDKSEGPLNERRYLNSLAGPNGEAITYERLGSCCHFETPNGFMGGGLLDRYEVRWKGEGSPVIIYINMYDYDVLRVPVGMTKK